MGKPKNTIWNLFSQIDSEGGLEACWCWTGGKHEDGYGVLRYQGKKHKAHRLLYQHFYHCLNSKIVVRHICDNPACCNPLHLIEGTQADNTKDMYERKRSRRGAHPWKLTTEQKMKICLLRKQGKSYPFIAKQVGCSTASAYRYANGIVT